MAWLVGILALSNGALAMLVIAWICWTARNTTGPIVSRFRIQFVLLTPFLVFAVIDARCLLLRIPLDPVFTFPQLAVHGVIWLLVIHLARSHRLGQQVGSLVELGRHDDAIELLRRRIAVRRTPDASLHNQLGNVYLQSGRIPEAVDELRRTVNLAPGVAPYRCNLAVVAPHDAISRVIDQPCAAPDAIGPSVRGLLLKSRTPCRCHLVSR